MAENFMRRYVMRCGPAKGKGFQIGNIDNAEETALHICFNIEKSDSDSPNDAKIQIWNLSYRNLAVLEEKDCTVELRAGYGDSMALILAGNVTSVITTAENADRMTEITVVDGNVELRDTALTISMKGSVNSRDIYNKIASEMGMAIKFTGSLKFKTLPTGFSYVGKAKNALKKLVYYTGHSWSIQNQILQITEPGKPLEATGYVLSKETGLIGLPKRIMIGSSGAEMLGWEVEYLLNGAIGINDAIKLRSSVVTGYFRVQKITLDGDNYDGDWICTAQLLEIPIES